MWRYFSKTKLNENKYLILGHLTFFALFVFSVVLAFERVIYIDSAAQIFEFIRDEGYEVYVRRYSMYFFQTFPVLAVKLHLPLSVVICTYSLSIPVIGYVLWLITVYFLKDRKTGILMLFVMLGIRHTFFHAISETFQLMFFATFLYAWLFQKRDFQKSVFSQTVYYLIACVFIALCIFIHPVAMFFVVFVLGIYILNRNISFSSKWILTIMSIGIIVLRFFADVKGSYNNSFMKSFPDFFNKVSHIFSLRSSIWFFERLTDFYWIPLLMLIVSLVFCWKNKRYWHLAFFSGFVILFWIITVVVYSLGGGDIGMERSFLPLFFFCGVPFVTEVFPKLSSKWNNVFFIVLTVLLLIGFVKIANASTSYTQRFKTIEQISTMANQQGTKKLLLTQETAKQIFPINNWGLGIESMIFSTLKGIDSTVNIYMINDITELNDEKYKNPNYYFAVPWWKFWSVDALNPHYFKFPKQLPSMLVLENGELVIKDLESY